MLGSMGPRFAARRQPLLEQDRDDDDDSLGDGLGRVDRLFWVNVGNVVKISTPARSDDGAAATRSTCRR